MTSLSDGLEKLEQIVAEARSIDRIVHQVEARCMAVDGPVTPTLREISEAEFAEAWCAANAIAALNLDPILSEIKRMREALRPRNSAVVSDMPIHETMAAHADYVEARGFDMRSVTATYLREGAAELSRLYALSTLSPQEPDSK